MRGPTRSVSFAVAALVASLAGSAEAQGNDRSAPTGGRSALMGNTGVALGQDGAAPFLNPATIVQIRDQSLAFSVNFFSFGVTNFSNWHQPGPVSTPQFGDVNLTNTGVSTNGFNVLPSTFCLFFTIAGVTAEGDPKGAIHKGRQKLAACIGNLEQTNFGLGSLSFNGTTSAGLTAQVQSFSVNWQRLYIGPTYSVSLSDDFAIGLSLHGVSTNDSFAIEGNSITSTPAGGSIQSSLGTGGSAHAIDLTALLGLTYHAGPFTFGASFQTPSLHFYGAYTGSLHNEYSGTGADAATLTSGSGSFNAPPPVRAAVGIGGSWQRLTLELDGSYEIPIASSIATSITTTTTNTTGGAVTSSQAAATYAITARPIVNAAVGAEYFLSPDFSVVGGVSTNLSSLPGIAPSLTLGNLVPARTNQANLSFGFGSYGSAGDVLIGVQLGYGWGEAVTANPYQLPNDWAVVDTRSYSATVILAGATNIRAIRRAVEKVESVMTTGKPDAKPSPEAPSPP